MATIREATTADHDAVIELWRGAGFGSTTEEEWNAVLTGNSARPLLAEDGGRIVGAAVASFDGWRAYIYHVAVASDARRQGIAKQLMGQAEAYLRQRGARRVYALVNGDNTAGLALAAVEGYMPEGDVVMEKELAGAGGTQTEAALARA